MEKIAVNIATAGGPVKTYGVEVELPIMRGRKLVATPSYSALGEGFDENRYIITDYLTGRAITLFPCTTIEEALSDAVSRVKKAGVDAALNALSKCETINQPAPPTGAQTTEG